MAWEEAVAADLSVLEEKARRLGLEQAAELLMSEVRSLNGQASGYTRMNNHEAARRMERDAYLLKQWAERIRAR